MRTKRTGRGMQSLRVVVAVLAAALAVHLLVAQPSDK